MSAVGGAVGSSVQPDRLPDKPTVRAPRGSSRPGVMEVPAEVAGSVRLLVEAEVVVVQGTVIATIG